MVIFQRLVVHIFLVLVFFLSTLKVGHAKGLACDHVYLIAQGFLSQHITFFEFNRNLEVKASEQFIKRLDPLKIYFLKSDVEQIDSLMKNSFELIKKRDCEHVEKIHKLFVQRMQDRLEYAKKILNKDFKFQKETSLLINSKKRDYFKTTTELENFQKKYIQFQVSNYLNTDLALKDAKDHVIRNYERSVKRSMEETKSDILAQYLDAFAHALDPHSNFLSHDVLEDFQISMSLSLEGIGATLSNQDGFTVVEQLVPGGAAEKSNLVEPKDKIIAVGQGDMGKFENVIEMELRDVVRKIRGKKGTKVRLRILRKVGEKQEKFDVTLLRDKIKLEDEAALITYVDREIKGQKLKFGVLNLPSFYADSKEGGRSSAKDLKQILKEVQKSKVHGLVFDLSKNGGGSLDDAVKIAGLFFKVGAVVKQSSRDPNQSERVLSDDDPAVDYSGPLVVLSSRVSASASEIVSGTLQDYGRAVIVGADHTFGKGSIQSVVPLPQQLGAFKVTIGMFFIPGGNSTQHKGVSADIVLPSIYSTEELGEKSLDYSLPPKQVKSFVSNEAYVKQGESAWLPIERANIEELKKRSQARVSVNAEFQKIVAEITKADKKKDDEVKVSDLLKEQEAQDKEDKVKLKKMKKEERVAEYLKRPDIEESISVLADLVMLQQGRLVTNNQANTSHLPADQK